METQDGYPNRYYQAAPYLAGALILGVGGCVATSDGDAFVAMFCSIAIATFALAGLVGAWLVGWGLERSLKFFRSGNSLGRWEVEGEQWLDFARAKRAKLAEGKRWAIAIMAVVLCLVVALAHDEPDLMGVLLGLMGIVFVGVFAGLHVTVGRLYGPGVTRATVEVGPGVVLLNGHALSFAGFGQRLTGIELDRDAKLLIVRGVAQSGETSGPFSHELPYPPEAEETAYRAMVALGFAYGLSSSDADD